MDFEDFVRVCLYGIALLFIFPTLIGAEALKTIATLILVIFPLFLGTAIIFIGLGYALEQYEYDPTEFKIKIKFWEWNLKRYLAFTVGTIVLTSIINKSFGFIVSLILLVIAVFVRVPYEYKKMMRDA